MKDLEPTTIHYSAILNLRESRLVEIWHETLEKVNLSCHNIKTRKYYRSQEIMVNCPLDINLMPLPSLMVAYPGLRLEK